MPPVPPVPTSMLSSRHPFTKTKDNETTERGSAMFLTLADSSFHETVDNNPVIFENGSKAR